MKTYKELKDELFEEVGKIDISKLELGFNGLSTYVDLLEKMSKLPDKTSDELIFKSLMDNMCSFVSSGLPKTGEE